MRTTNKYVFFWNGIYSQWYSSPVTIDGMEFNCMEQWMMWNKAKLFGDDEVADLIMEATHPSTQKGLGREVKRFNKEMWDAEAYDIVVKGNYAKFTQHKDLQEELLNTKDLTLVEASPYDTIWGIGMREDDHGVEDEENWKGLNLLGKAITEVKIKIQNELQGIRR
jgi:ribA/ribD-fused uncharacterized protein